MTTRNLFPIFDGHNDTLLHLHMTERGEGRNFFVRSEKGHIDLPRAKLGGFAGGFFAIFCPTPSQLQMTREDLVITETGYEVRPFPAIDPVYAQQWTISVAARPFLLATGAPGTGKVDHHVYRV